MLRERDGFDNPYAPPKAEIGRVEPPAGVDLSEAEAIRRAHLGRERAIKALSWPALSLGFFSGFFAIGTAVILIVEASGIVPRSEFGGSVPFELATAAYTSLMVISLVLGQGLRRLQNWARLTWIVLAALLLSNGIVVSIIMGTIERDPLMPLVLITIYLLLAGPVLAVLVPKKAARICSEDYRRIIAATPHVRNRTSRGTILVLVIVVVIVLALIAGVIISG